ncbi:uncharacterized protein CTRU02_207862 [Colletotrichum truncatum]|uniref:Uncharacterized protein n=1 Tax=Colletotrichum truncatum TaxID=5467 RepID=A0ACC3Z218_COLTU
MPSSLTPRFAQHCVQPANCGAVVQGTACDFCCPANVKPDSTHCKARDAKCADGGTTFNCDDD